MSTIKDLSIASEADIIGERDRTNEVAAGAAQLPSDAMFMHRGERPLEEPAKKMPTELPEDTLEYFIKFPAPQYDGQIAVEEDIQFKYNETNAPVVMLLGWAGCQDRYLMKYSKIYEERG